MDESRRNYSQIVTASAVLVGLTLIHDLDHVRQDRALDIELYGIGTVSLIAGLIVLFLAARGHSLAPFAARVLGIGTVVGVFAIHVAPTWWPLSDSYGDAGVDIMSWAVISAMIASGAWLAYVGWAATPQRVST